MESTSQVGSVGGSVGGKEGPGVGNGVKMLSVGSMTLQTALSSWMKSFSGYSSCKNFKNEPSKASLMVVLTLGRSLSFSKSFGLYQIMSKP